jgi:hypothetical protein
VDALLPAAAINYGRLQSVAANYNNGGPDAAETELVVLLADALAFVGNVERLRKIVTTLGGDPEFRIAKRAFLSTVNNYEPARHHIEHLDTALVDIADTGDQALMAMSWFAPNADGTGFAIRCVFFRAREGGFGPATALPVSVRLPVDHLMVRVAGADYNLTAAHDALQSFWRRVREWSNQWGATDVVDPSP